MNKKVKHNKLKNTGILFELLSKQVATDILSNKKNASLDLIKKYFKAGSVLQEELSYYHMLLNKTNQKPSTANKLLDIILERQSKINTNELKREKYKLISEIKKHYDIDSFFDSRISNYKLLASIYKLFEYSGKDTVVSHLNSCDTVLEHLTAEKNNIVETKQDPELSPVVFKLIVERFNKKYKTLNQKQKTLINRFINENVSTSEFQQFIYSEVDYIRNTLTSLTEQTYDVPLKIKLTEVVNLLNRIVTSKRIKDEHISSMLKYYELIGNLQRNYK